MEYIATAKKLAAKVFRYSNGLPKRYAFKLGNPVFEHAAEVVYHCSAANLTYVKDDASFALRRNHLTEAEGHLQHVECLLGILYEVTMQIHDEELSRLDAKLAERGLSVHDVMHPDVAQALKSIQKAPNENVFGEFADMIELERNLIRGVKTRDTQAYNRMREKQ